MDPNENLKVQRELVGRILDSLDRDLPPDVQDAYDLASHAHALDCWLKRGGFLPEDWKTLPVKEGQR